MKELFIIFIITFSFKAMAFPVFHIAGQEEFNKKVIIPIMNYTDSIKNIEKKYLSKDYYNINLLSGETTKLTPEKLYMTCKWSKHPIVTDTHTLEDIVVDGKVQEKGIDSFCETRVQFKEIYNKNIHNIIVEENIKLDFAVLINRNLIHNASLKRESIQSYYNNPKYSIMFGERSYTFTHSSHNDIKPKRIMKRKKESILKRSKFYILTSKHLDILTDLTGSNANLIIKNKYFLCTGPSTDANRVIVYSYFKINNKEYVAFKLNLNYHKEYKNQYRIANITDMKLEESHDLVYGSNFAYHGF